MCVCVYTAVPGMYTYTAVPGMYTAVHYTIFVCGAKSSTVLLASATLIHRARAARARGFP